MSCAKELVEDTVGVEEGIARGGEAAEQADEARPYGGNVKRVRVFGAQPIEQHRGDLIHAGPVFLGKIAEQGDAEGSHWTLRETSPPLAVLALSVVTLRWLQERARAVP